MYFLLKLHEHGSANSLRDPIITAVGKKCSKSQSDTDSLPSVWKWDIWFNLPFCCPNQLSLPCLTSKSMEKCNPPCALENRAPEMISFLCQILPFLSQQHRDQDPKSSYQKVWRQSSLSCLLTTESWASFSTSLCLFCFSSVNGNKQCLLHHMQIFNFYNGLFLSIFLPIPFISSLFINSWYWRASNPLYIFKIALVLGVFYFLYEFCKPFIKF